MAKEAPTRERMEEALRESEERFRRLAENAPDVIFRYRFIPTPGYEYISPAVTAITGYTPQEFYADPDLDLKIIHPDDRQTLQRMIEQPLSDPRALRWIRKDGAIVWLEHHNAPIYDEEGDLVAVEGIARDITERKQAEDALRISRMLLEKTFASLKEAVFVVDPNTRRIIACNSAAERIFGYSEKEMIGHNTEFLHVDQASYADFGRQLFSALDENGVFHTEYQVRRKNGDIFFSDHTVTEIVDDSGRRTGLVSVVRDITENKRMEEALQAARDQLEGKVERQMLRRNPYGLTFRELTVLHLVAVGESDKQIGLKLGISHFTAQKHTSNILAKMGAGSRTEAAARALREGMLD